MHPKKITFEQKREKVNQLTQGRLELIDDYRGNIDVPHKLRCNKCGFEFHRSFSTLKSCNSTFCKNKKCENASHAIRGRMTLKEKAEFLESTKLGILLEDSDSNKNHIFACLVCGDLIERKWSEVRRGNQRCLNFLCTNRARGCKIPFFLFEKSEIFSEVKLLNPPDNGFVKHLEKATFICRCGKKHSVMWGALIEKAKTGKNKAYCLDCARIFNFKRGSEHQSWKENPLVERNKSRRNADFLWEVEIKRLYDFTCVISRERGGKLASHHLNAFGFFEDQRLLLSNGVCLTDKIHKEFHKKYGKNGHNTEEQFSEFFKEKTGLTWDKRKKEIFSKPFSPDKKFLLAVKELGKTWIKFSL